MDIDVFAQGRMDDHREERGGSWGDNLPVWKGLHLKGIKWHLLARSAFRGRKEVYNKDMIRELTDDIWSTNGVADQYSLAKYFKEWSAWRYVSDGIPDSAYKLSAEEDRIASSTKRKPCWWTASSLHKIVGADEEEIWQPQSREY